MQAVLLEIIDYEQEEFLDVIVVGMALVPKEQHLEKLFVDRENEFVVGSSG